MPMSFRLFNVGETEVRVHATFFLLLAWIAVVYATQDGAAAAAGGVLFVVLLFVCVVLHEFGHVLTARRYGIHTPHVTLLPIGGVASLERMPENPAQEILVALAGPAVNLVIAVVLVLVLGARFEAAQLWQLDETGSNLLSRVAAANTALAVFNMLPAFPMDGGRVLRAVLSFRFERMRATRIAASIGQFLAFGLGFLGLLGNPVLVLIALFIYFAAGAEAKQAEMQTLAMGYRAGDAMITAFEALSPQSTADDAAALLLETTQQEFPVLDASRRLVGLVRRHGLIEALKKGDGATPVPTFMETSIPMVGPDSSLDGVLEHIAMAGSPAVGVVGADGSLLGYVTAENLTEIFMIRAARELRRAGTAKMA